MYGNEIRAWVQVEGCKGEDDKGHMYFPRLFLHLMESRG